jgi:2-octaprenylphenol hydroxylase
MAALLDAVGITVMVIEQGAAPDFTSDNERKGAYDLRTLALTRASQFILTNGGAWAAIVADRACGFTGMEVWEAGSGQDPSQRPDNAAQAQRGIRYQCADIGEPVLGFIVEHSVVLAALLDVLDQRRMSPRYGAGVVGFVVREQAIGKSKQQSRTAQEFAGVEVELDSGELIRARLLVGADGQDSKVRQLAGIAPRAFDYQQQAVVATVATELEHEHTARQIFLPTGPLAFLPLADANKSSIIWSTTPALATELESCDDEEFAARIADAFEYRLGEVSWCSARSTFPLQRLHATRYIAPRVALVGDAAHCVHPLAGQGANQGLLDVACLVQVLSECADDGRPRWNPRSHDIGGDRVLRRYERWRKGDNTIVQWALDGLQTLFASEHAELKRLRVDGLRIADQIPLLKRFIMRYASGVAGDLPIIAREIQRRV